MSRWAYRPGDYYIVCDTCGERFYRSECQIDHDGYLVCKTCFDPQHPQERIRVKAERSVPKDPRPEGTDYFLSYGEVTRDDL